MTILAYILSGISLLMAALLSFGQKIQQDGSPWHLNQLQVPYHLTWR